VRAFRRRALFGLHKERPDDQQAVEPTKAPARATLLRRVIHASGAPREALSFEDIVAKQTSGNGDSASSAPADGANSAPGPGFAGAVAAGSGQQLIVNAQYIKDLSFENPRAPQSLMQQSGPPAVEINVDVKAQSLGPETFEVVLSVNASAKVQADPLFLIELTYGAIVTVRNTPQEVLPILVLVETPRLIFPFARNIIAEATRDGGFPPLMINPIDFAELMRRNQAQSQQPPAASPATA
jgi:preprotein translocase subunit SecB